MRLHTNVLQGHHLWAAARLAAVGFYKWEDHGSRIRDRAYEIRLEGHSNHLLNFGDGYTTAATWDEWGIFFGELFRQDPHMIAGSAASNGWGYRGRRDFQRATFNRFDHLRHADQHKNHRWVSLGNGESECKCGAMARWNRPRITVTRAGCFDLTVPTERAAYLRTAKTVEHIETYLNGAA